MILLIIGIIVGIVLWVAGMGLTARLDDGMNEEVGILFLFWWIILPIQLLINLYEIVRGW
jgi:hypothetical protein